MYGIRCRKTFSRISIHRNGSYLLYRRDSVRIETAQFSSFWGLYQGTLLSFTKHGLRSAVQLTIPSTCYFSELCRRPYFHPRTCWHRLLVLRQTYTSWFSELCRRPYFYSVFFWLNRLSGRRTADNYDQLTATLNVFFLWAMSMTLFPLENLFTTPILTSAYVTSSLHL